jgi:hypothetical protein
MKRLIGVLIFFFLVTAMGCAHNTAFPVYTPNENCKLVSFKPGLEPGGFNGIKWETELLTLKEMKSYRKDPSHGGIHFYLKAGDGYKLKNGKLIPIQYGFWREKFYIGMVMTDQVSDFEALKESVFEKFGVGAKPFINKEEYLWIGKGATMALRYDENLRKGTYYIRSHSMEKQMQ